MALPFVSAGAHAPHSDETPGPTATQGSPHSARRLRSLAFLCSSFDFEATHLTELDRIETLLTLLATAFCWAHLLGEWLHEQKLIPIKSHYRPAISIFRYGLD